MIKNPTSTTAFYGSSMSWYSILLFDYPIVDFSRPIYDCFPQKFPFKCLEASLAHFSCSVCSSGGLTVNVYTHYSNYVWFYSCFNLLKDFFLVLTLTSEYIVEGCLSITYFNAKWINLRFSGLISVDVRSVKCLSFLISLTISISWISLSKAFS